MTSYNVDIINPKADKLLKDLADLNLISISKRKNESFNDVLTRLRKKASQNPPTLEEITKEVEIVRAKNYAKRKA